MFFSRKKFMQAILFVLFVLLSVGFAACGKAADESLPKEFLGNYYSNDGSYIVLNDNTIQTYNTQIGKLITFTVYGTCYVRASMPKTKVRIKNVCDGIWVFEYKKAVNAECFNLDGMSLGNYDVLFPYVLDASKKIIFIWASEYTKID